MLRSADGSLPRTAAAVLLGLTATLGACGETAQPVYGVPATGGGGPGGSGTTSTTMQPTGGGGTGGTRATGGGGTGGTSATGGGGMGSGGETAQPAYGVPPTGGGQ